MTPITLPGVGEVPERFSIAFQGVNLEWPKVRNHHNENQIVAQCNRNDFADDDFNVSGQKLPDGKYKVSVAMESENGIAVFNSGRVDLLYDPTTQRWSMTAWVNDGQTPWKFCDSKAMVDIVTAGLDCLKGSAEAKPHTDSIDRIVKSIRQGKALLASSAPKYSDRTDCTTQLTAYEICDSIWCAPPGSRD